MTESVDQQGRAARLRRTIADISRRPKKVTLGEIESIVNRLSEFHPVKTRKARHGYLFTLGDRQILVNAHNPGDRNVKVYSVKDFLKVMIDLGWLEE